MAKSEKVVEAILQASDNATVADYLVRRAADPVDPEWIRLWGGISKEGEFALLERGDRLIDLRLAEFCQHKTTARALFHRDDEDTVLRALVLSNRAQSFALPEALFRDITEEEWKDDPERHPLYRVESLLQRITLEEVQALFENPAISESFLAKFLMASHYPPASRVMYWQALPPEIRHQALWALSRNPLLQRWASERRKGAVVVDRLGCTNAAWGLLKLLDVTVPNVQALAELCEQLIGPVRRNERELAESLQRWVPQDDDEREREQEDNRQKRLSAYQRVRRAASATLLRSRKTSQTDLLQSDDLALRCGAYMGGGFSILDVPMTPELMQQGIRRDGWLAAQSMLQNPVCWKTAEGRELMLSEEAMANFPDRRPIVDAYVDKIHEDLSEADLKAWVENLTPEDRAVLDPFLNKDERIASDEEMEDRLRTQQQWLERSRKEHPDWFTDNAQKIGDDQSAIPATQLAQIRKSLASVARWQSIQFCLVVGALAVLFFR